MAMVQVNGNLKKTATKLIKVALAKKSFYDFCKLSAPEFYKDENDHLKFLCDELQEFIESPSGSFDDLMIVNIPPEHGKTRTAVLLSQWLLGLNPLTKIIVGAYNETLSSEFSKAVRDRIQEKKADEDYLTYADFFPNSKIKYGSAAAMLWSLNDNTVPNFLATSPHGTVTGLRGNYHIYDDLIKNDMDAKNERVLDETYAWITNTMLSRLMQGGKRLFFATRWATKDPSGRLIAKYPDAKILILRAETNGKMLCPNILNINNYEAKRAEIGSDTFAANYNQEPIDLKNALYNTEEFRTYKTLPPLETIESYTDTADAGKDYLCSIIYGKVKNEAYVLDVVYTQANMNVTEKILAEKHLQFKVNYARIEANSGGRLFSTNVESGTRALGNMHTVFLPFTQTNNKEARILTASSGIHNAIIFPEDWSKRWTDFYLAIKSYQRIGKNNHDDAPDALSGVYERLSAVPWN